MNETFPANTPQPPGSGETFPDTAPGRTPTPSTSPAAAINLHSVPDPRPRLTITRRAVQSELARRSLPDFARRCVPGFCPTPFHTAYYRTLDAFAKGLVRRLIVSVPPQHGKSLGSSVLLPAYALGIRPGLRIALASYNLRLASRFNRRIQQLIDSAPYAELFPDTRLKPLHGGTGNKKEAAAPSAAGAGNLVRTAEEFDLAGQSGGLLAVGREGSLTGNTVDLLILDDLFKDALEANSPLVRDNAWEWYNAVARTRLHNGSQELIVGTRWHEEDLPGRIAAHERVVGLTDFSQLGTLPPDCWLMLNFEAIKESPPTPADPRGKGEGAAWRDEAFERLPIGRGRRLTEGDDMAVLTIGPVGNVAARAVKRAAAEGVLAAHYDLRFARPLDEELLDEVGRRFEQVVTVEDGVVRGGVGSAVRDFFDRRGYRTQVRSLGIPDDRFVEHGTPAELYAQCGFDEEGILRAILGC